MNRENEIVRNYYIDIIKVIAIVFVIIAHDPWSVESSTKNLIFPFFIDMAVPLFMIVSGFNYTNSCISKNRSTATKLYDIFYIKKKLLRFLIPYIIVLSGEIILLITIKKQSYCFSDVIEVIIRGGYGPGSYFTLIMIQFIFISPLLYLAIEKWKGKGVLYIFVINFLFEFIFTILKLPDSLYPFSIIRFLFFIALGVMWAMGLHKNINKYLWWLSLGLGVFYLIYIYYLCEPSIFTRWSTTSMMVGFYIMPGILVGESRLTNITIPSQLQNLLVLCSNATFHIFLFQMFYYYIGIERIFTNLPICIRIVGSIAICLIMGCLFYKALEYMKIQFFDIERDRRML